MRAVQYNYNKYSILLYTTNLPHLCPHQISSEFLVSYWKRVSLALLYLLLPYNIMRGRVGILSFYIDHLLSACHTFKRICWYCIALSYMLNSWPGILNYCPVSTTTIMKNNSIIWLCADRRVFMDLFKLLILTVLYLF